jgi:hypothetical protein
MMGQWAVAAMVDLELSGPEAMLKRRDAYPSPWVRLRLLAETAAQLGLDGRSVLPRSNPGEPPGDGFDALAAQSSEATDDLGTVPHVVETALGKLEGLPMRLADLAAFRKSDFQPGGSVDLWSAAFRRDESRQREKGLRLPRLLMSATEAAWWRVLADAKEAPAANDESERERLRAVLRGRAVDEVTASGPEGTRAGAPEAAAVGGEALGEFLLKTEF